MNKPISIAIDGPVGSGKGTLALALAKKLGALYVNTGAMYRELGLLCLRNNIDMKDGDRVLETFEKNSIEIKSTEKGVRAILNGEDVSEEIFTPSVSQASSSVAIFPQVRKAMVIKQKEIAENAIKSEKSVVMEGRDITTDVIPNADMRIYLTADIKTRAQRRFEQFKNRGVKTELNDVLKDLEERDRKDAQRSASPLRIAEGAVVIDTTNDTIDETVDRVMGKLKEKNLA